EDFREPRAGPVIVLPGPVVLLVAQEVFEAAAHTRGGPVAEREDRHQCPGRLRRRARANPFPAGLVVGAGELSPSAVLVLVAPQPAARPLVALRREILAGGLE